MLNYLIVNGGGNMKRNVSLDLLRIIAMIMIVTLHVLGKGNGFAITDPVIRMFSWTLEALCIVAVNLYVLISGYFLLDSKFKVKKVLLLWGKVIFYSWLMLLIFKCLGLNIGFKNAFVSIFPILTKDNYWFITVYLLMYVLSPFINTLINSMDKKNHFNLILILIIFFSIISFVLPHGSLLDPSCGTGIIWFVTLYVVAAYIKKYVAIDVSKRKLYLCSYIAFSLLTTCAYFSSELAAMMLGHDGVTFMRIYMYNPFFVFMASVSLFLALIQMIY